MSSIVLTSLPNEILLQIVKHLDCSDLLLARRTCRTLHAVTKTHEVWRTVVCELQKRGASPLEEKAGNYTAEELELWSSRRCHIRSVLTGSAQPNLRNRLINLHTDTRYPAWRGYYRLVPGGRWLLYGQPSRVVTFDLDSGNPKSRLLFDTREIDQAIVDRQRSVVHKLWVDRLKSYLSFRVVARVIESQNPRAHIYHVDSVGHGPGAVLVAKHLSTLCGLKQDQELAIVLNEHYFVEVLDVSNNETRKGIAIYHYGNTLTERIECSNKPSAALEVDGSDFFTVEFIHANILAYYTGMKKLHIFEVVSDVGGLTSTPHSIELLHTIPFEYRSHSDVRWSIDASKMVLISDGNLKGYLLPHDKTAPIVLELGRLDPFTEEPKIIGVFATLFFSWSFEGHSEIVTYYWDQASEARPKLYSLPISIPRPTLWNRTLLINFDEEVGRLVFVDSTVRYLKLLVVDLI